MSYLRPILPHLACFLLLLATEPFASLAARNGLAQLLLFVPVVLVPTWRTGRMSWVDIGWPLGLAVIGTLVFSMGSGHPLRIQAIGVVYLAMGLRMGLGALLLWRRGHLDQELPRYAYQRIRWERRGITNVPLIMQSEALSQGLANMSFLALPALLMASNEAASLHPLEIVGSLIWMAAFGLEWLADAQKLAFLRRMRRQGQRNQVCDAGLWRYSRHPNYFAEWMVWNALILAALPSWIALKDQMDTILWLVVGACTLFTSRLMYAVLVNYTGARPAEFYSAQRRPGYRDYQARTNMFFPGPVKRTR